MNDIETIKRAWFALGVVMATADVDLNDAIEELLKRDVEPCDPLDTVDLIRNSEDVFLKSVTDHLLGVSKSCE